MGRVDAKVALISGGARGMGASHARLLVAEGAKVVIGDILDDEGAGAGCRIGRRGALRAPRRDEAVGLGGRGRGGGGAIREARTSWSTTPGSSTTGPLKTFDLTKWQQVLDVNVTGTLLGIQAVVDPMIAAGGGSIVNISSIEGLRGAAWVHGYVTSKWAVRGLTKSAALELAPNNIRVNSVHPGFIRTAMTEKLPQDVLNIPLGRPGEPQDVSAFVLFLASDESAYATAAEFVVDGGLVEDVSHKG